MIRTTARSVPSCTRIVAQRLRVSVSKRGLADGPFSRPSSNSGSSSRPSAAMQAATATHHPTLDIYNYPPSKRNTVLNICAQGNTMVVERLGKFHKVAEPGWFLAIPFIDQISYVHDMRELALRVDPQGATSKDNVSVFLGGNVYLQFEDAKLASYGAKRPLYAVMQHAQSALRAAVGTMELDELFHNRDKLNTSLRAAIETAAKKWGVQVLRFEITEIIPDDRIRQAMDLQAVAERERREETLRAEATKRSMELRSEGKRQQDINESEGIKIRMVNEGEGEKQRIIKQAEGEAEAIVARARATAGAIGSIAEVLVRPNGEKAMAFALAKEYFEAFSKIAGESNTVIIPQDVGNMSGMVATGMAVLERVHQSTKHVGGRGGQAAIEQSPQRNATTDAYASSAAERASHATEQHDEREQHKTRSGLSYHVHNGV